MILVLKRFVACAVAMNSIASSPAFAQSYPSKPIRVFIEVPAGSVTDVVFRQAAQELLPRLGQPVIADNRAGANGIIAMEACAKAVPDGHTLCLVAPNGISFNAHVFSKLPYDPDKDFKGITRLFFLIESVLATASLSANSIKELQALAAAKPGSLNAGTLGPGSQPDVFRQWLAERWKTQIVGVPYKGGAPVLNALLAGEVHFAQIGLGNAAGILQSGKIKVLAVGGSKRQRLLPSVPTMEEAGLKDAPGSVFWGIVAPVGTADAIVKRLHAEFARLFRDDPKFVELLESRFLEPSVTTPEEFDAYLKAHRAYSGELVKRFNIPRQ